MPAMQAWWGPRVASARTAPRARSATSPARHAAEVLINSITFADPRMMRSAFIGLA